MSKSKRYIENADLRARVQELEAEVAHLRWTIEIREGEIRHLQTQLGLVPTVGIFRTLSQIFREATETQAAKVRRMTVL